MIIEITEISVNEIYGFARVHYNDNSSLIVTIREAKELADTYNISFTN